MFCTVDKNLQLQRAILALLIIFLLGNLAGHVFIPSVNSAHAGAESSCPIHNGMLLADWPHIAVSQVSISIDVAYVCAHALQWNAKIPHPPTS